MDKYKKNKPAAADKLDRDVDDNLQPQELKSKLDALGSELKNFQQDLATREPRIDNAESDKRKTSGSYSNATKGLKLVSEFISPIIVGAAIGFGIDKFFNTIPWFLFIFLFLGFFAGILSILRELGKISPFVSAINDVNNPTEDNFVDTKKKKD